LRLADAYEMLAQRYGQAEQPDKATGALRTSLTLCRETIGEDQPKVASLLRELARLEEELGRFAEAEQDRVKAVKLLRHRFGERHPAAAEAIERLAGHYAARSLVNEADQHYRQALDLLGQNFGLASPALHTTMQAYIGFLKQDGRHSDAIRLEAARRQLDATAYNPGAGIERPRLVKKAEPEYSPEAQEMRVTGSVELSLIVDEQGRPSNLWVTAPLGFGLDEKALEAVAQWRFTPARKQGAPVPVVATIEMHFRLL
jgi:TonB family protein